MDKAINILLGVALVALVLMNLKAIFVVAAIGVLAVLLAYRLGFVGNPRHRA